MVVPFSSTVFAAGTNANATGAIVSNGAVGGGLILQYIGTGFSGTLDIQGKIHAAATFVNIPYYILAVGPIAQAVAQISKTTDSSNQIIAVPIALPFMQVVMTRSAGTLAMYAHFPESGFSLDIA